MTTTTTTSTTASDMTTSGGDGPHVHGTPVPVTIGAASAAHAISDQDQLRCNENVGIFIPADQSTSSFVEPTPLEIEIVVTAPEADILPAQDNEPEPDFNDNDNDNPNDEDDEADIEEGGIEELIFEDDFLREIFFPHRGPRRRRLPHRINRMYGTGYCCAILQRLLEFVKFLAVTFWDILCDVYREPSILPDLFIYLFKLVVNLEYLNIVTTVIYRPLEYLFTTFNIRVVLEVAKEEEKSWPVIRKTVAQLTCLIGALYFAVAGKDMYFGLIYLPVGPPHVHFFEVRSTVIVIDYLAKFGTVLLKMIVVALPGYVLSYSRRNNIFHFIEMSSQLYRSLLPIPAWVTFFTAAFSSWALAFQVFGYLMAVFYVYCKVSIDSRKRIRHWWDAVGILNKWNYGLKRMPPVKPGVTVYVDEEEPFCAICYDKFDNPMMLQCKHVFCEKCITSWFSVQCQWRNKENTCPLCCAKVVSEEWAQFRNGETLSRIMHI